jgi:hypothetical protein
MDELNVIVVVVAVVAAAVAKDSLLHEKPLVSCRVQGSWDIDFIGELKQEPELRSAD